MGLEIEFLPVGDGSGDAICVRNGTELFGYQIYQIDGGHTSTADTIIAHIEKYYGRDATIDHMVLSHADDDHARGLPKVLERFHVTNLWMNRPWLYVNDVVQHFHQNYTVQGLYDKMRELHPYLIELEEIVEKKNKQTLFPTRIREAFQGERIGDFLVLAPSRARYIELIPELPKTPTSYKEGATTIGGFFADAVQKVADYLDENWHLETLSNNPNPPTSASNETSIVQLGLFENRRVLLTADVGPAGLAEAADYAERCGLLTPPNFVQVPHHGSRRNVTPDILDRWLGQRQPEGSANRGVAFCSVGKNKEDYPRGAVTNAFSRRGYPIHSQRGQPKRQPYDMPARDGWTDSIPEPFQSKVKA